MTDSRAKYIQALIEFKTMVLNYKAVPSPLTRSEIVKRSKLVRTLVTKARAGRSITISLPPAVGGVVMRNLDPFDLIFVEYYGVDIIGTVIDCVDEAIGAIESDEKFSLEQPLATQKTQNAKMDKSGNSTIYKEKILGMSQEAFWPLLVATIGAVFYLGFRLGQAKFDSEKIDLYNSNQSYKRQNDNLLRQLGIEQMNVRELTDSLNDAKVVLKKH